MAGRSAPNEIVLPARLVPGDGRFGSGPSKVRTEAVARLVDAAGGYLGTSHRRDDGASRSSGGCATGLAELFDAPRRLRGAARQRRHHHVLGRRRVRAHRAAQPAPRVRRVLVEVRRGHARRAAPRDPVVIETEPGTHPEPVADADRRRVRLPHNETSTGVDDRDPPARRRAPTVSSSSSTRTSGAGGAAARPDADRRLLLRAAEVLRQRRRALARAVLARGRSSGSSGSPRRAAGVPPSLDLAIALENSRLDQTYNTPALATLFLLADTIDWMLEHGGLDWAASRCDRSAEILYGWAEASPVATPFVAKPAERSHVTATIDFDGVDADDIAAVLRAERHRRHRAVPQARSQPAAHRACSRRSSPTTSRR